MNDVLNEAEVAEILDCEPSTVQEKARLGELPAIKFGRSWRFPRVALLESLNARALANKPKAAPARGVQQRPALRRMPPALPNAEISGERSDSDGLPGYRAGTELGEK